MMIDQNVRQRYASLLAQTTDQLVEAQAMLELREQEALEVSKSLETKTSELEQAQDLIREQSKLIDQQRRHLDLVRSAGIEIHDTTDAEELRKMVTGHEAPQEIVFNNKDDDSDPDD